VVQVPPLELVASATVASWRLASLGLAVLAVASLSLPVGAFDGDGLYCLVSGRCRRLLALAGSVSLQVARWLPSAGSRGGRPNRIHTRNLGRMGHCDAPSNRRVRACRNTDWSKGVACRTTSTCMTPPTFSGQSIACNG
jgi:hypothetical protein